MYNDHCNFKYFFHGFMLLFRSATGESWNGIMHDVMTEHPNAWVFFVLFMIFVSALLFELITAIILDQYVREVFGGAVPLGESPWGVRFGISLGGSRSPPATNRGRRTAATDQDHEAYRHFPLLLLHHPHLRPSSPLPGTTSLLDPNMTPT